MFSYQVSNLLHHLLSDLLNYSILSDNNHKAVFGMTTQARKEDLRCNAVQHPQDPESVQHSRVHLSCWCRLFVKGRLYLCLAERLYIDPTFE